jgi:hypothetical protein
LKKDYAYTEETMRKAELGLLGVAVPEAYGGLGMGFVSTMLVCDYISGQQVHSRLLWSTYRNGTMPITLYGSKEQKTKYVPKLASGEWFGAVWGQVLDLMLIQEKQKQFYLKMETYHHRSKNVVSNAGFLCLSFLLVLKKILQFHC